MKVINRESLVYTEKAVLGVYDCLACEDSAKVEFNTCNAGKEVYVLKSKFDIDNQITTTNIKVTDRNDKNKLLMQIIHDENTNTETILYFGCK